LFGGRCFDVRQPSVESQPRIKVTSEEFSQCGLRISWQKIEPQIGCADIIRFFCDQLTVRVKALHCSGECERDQEAEQSKYLAFEGPEFSLVSRICGKLPLSQPSARFKQQQHSEE
jgi:hypothetical protein